VIVQTCAAEVIGALTFYFYLPSEFSLSELIIIWYKNNRRLKTICFLTCLIFTPADKNFSRAPLIFFSNSAFNPLQTRQKPRFGIIEPNKLLIC
jgi:hypothetical protein